MIRFLKADHVGTKVTINWKEECEEQFVLIRLDGI